MMAEFWEVMKQAKRMCAQQNNSCEGCPLHDDGIECPVEGPPESWKLNMFAEYERIVMDWAAKNQEPRYLSWHEAWKQLFPGGQGSPCPASYDMKYEPEWCGRDGCDKCRNQPIAADVAEKLGIKPIGGGGDA